MDKDQEGILRAESLHNMNTGITMGKAVEPPNPYREVKTLTETKEGLQKALVEVASIITDDLGGPGRYSAVDLSRLSGVSAAILHGVNYLEHVEETFKTIKEVTGG
jgi:hypothetical protein